VTSPMLQALASQPPPVANVPVNIEVGLVDGPDGRPWVRYAISEGLHQHVVVVPVNTARRMGPMITDLTLQALGAVPATSALVLPHGVRVGPRDSGQ
jgi:hypothetical protein